MTDEGGTRSIGVGIIGLGFMGQTHLAAYRAAASTHPNHLVGVCDARIGRLSGDGSQSGNLGMDDDERLFDPATVQTCTDPADLFANDKVELVSICSPTDTHVDLAIAALRAGKHVLVEKPVALDASTIETLQEEARSAGKLCMPAMCIRFWPAWSWLKERIDEGTFGAVKSATFRRLGTTPDWNPEFYGNAQRSGGALFDLHVHDVDFVHWCFGTPEAVTASGTPEHVTAAYRYPGGLEVVAEGAWDRPPEAPFHMGYLVVFEEGTAEYAFQRDPELIVATQAGTETIELPASTGYDGEVRHLLDAIARGASDEELTARLTDAIAHTRTLELERAALSD